MHPIFLSASGGVCLGDDVICDGFRADSSIRIQTHIHDDHMKGWSESKMKDIVLSHATRDLLIAQFGGDLADRSNIRPLELDKWHDFPKAKCKIKLLSSSHMLGATQVIVQLSTGEKVGYSGDFSWPLAKTEALDALVIDSTNGCPGKTRLYDETDADAAFIDRVNEYYSSGHIHILANRGTLHRAVQLLADQKPMNILATSNRLDELSVYSKYGYALPDVTDINSNEGQELLNTANCVILYSKGDRQPVDKPIQDGMIKLASWLQPSANPLVEYGHKHCRISMCDHADFEGCIDYVRATGAKYVLVDVRGNHALDLAIALQERLGINAEAAEVINSREWGA